VGAASNGVATVSPRRLGRILPDIYLRPFFRIASLKLEFSSVQEFGQILNLVNLVINARKIKFGLENYLAIYNRFGNRAEFGL
jgi:hypothetical protein